MAQYRARKQAVDDLRNSYRPVARVVCSRMSPSTALTKLFNNRYGTGSGSDRAPLTRSLPLPVPYRRLLSRTRYCNPLWKNGRGSICSGRDREKDTLEAQRGAQVYGAVPARSAYDAEVCAEDVQSAWRSAGWVAGNGPVEGPPRMIQHVVGAGENL